MKFLPTLFSPSDCGGRSFGGKFRKLAHLLTWLDINNAVSDRSPVIFTILDGIAPRLNRFSEKNEKASENSFSIWFSLSWRGRRFRSKPCLCCSISVFGPFVWPSNQFWSLIYTHAAPPVSYTSISRRLPSAYKTVHCGPGRKNRLIFVTGKWPVFIRQFSSRSQN